MACSLSLLQASCQTCTLQHQHPGNSQHPWRQDTPRGLHYRWWPHSSPQVATVRPLHVKRNISAGKTEILNLLFKMFVSPVRKKNPKMASAWLVHTMNRSAANLPPPMLPQIVVLLLMCLIRGDGWKIVVLHHISNFIMVNQGRFLWFKLIIVLWPADTVESSAIMISPRTRLRRITSCPSAGPPTWRHTATTTTLAWWCHTTGWLAPIRPTDKHVS